MTIRGVAKMIWNKITGKDISSDVLNCESRVDLWRRVYAGRADWLEYSYPTLTGHLQKRIRKSMKPAYLVVSEIAGLIWSERPELTVDPFTMDVLVRENFIGTMQRETEYLLALGAVIPKLYVENGKIKIDFVGADRFIPISWDSTGIHDADIIDRRIIKKRQYIRVEKHRRQADGTYIITSETYEEIGATLVPAQLSLFGIEDAESYSPVKLFQYIGVPGGNNLDIESPLSISVFANALDTIESLDIAFDALQSEIVLGKKRIIVPASAVRTVIDAETGKPIRYFDPSDEVYQAFSGDDKEQLKITDNTLDLRIEEIRLAIKTLVDILCIQTGVNPGYLSFDGQSMKTATEVISENSKTFKTKKGLENAIGDGIVEMCMSIQILGAYLKESVGSVVPSIEWDDSVIEDRNSAATYYHSRMTGGTIESWRAIMKLDGCTEEEAKTRAAEIKKEKATVDVGALFGGQG